MIKYLKSRNLPALRSVEPWENEYGSGIKITTAHYEVLTTLLDPLILSEVPGFMESCYRGYQNQFPEPVRTNFKFTVYLFGQRSQWEQFTRSFTGKQAEIYCKIKAGAYYLNGACVAYNIGRQRTFSVLGHEGWHQFNSRLFKYRLPSWLDEGVAMLFETSRNDKGLFYFEPAMNLSRLGSLKQTLMKRKTIPLKTLLAMNPGQAIVTGEDAVMAFYSQAYALARFLREEDYGRRLGNYHQLLLGGLHGQWPLDPIPTKIAANRNIPLTVRWNQVVGRGLFEHYIGNDLEKIQEEYIRFCRKIVYRIRLK